MWHFFIRWKAESARLNQFGLASVGAKRPHLLCHQLPPITAAQLFSVRVSWSWSGDDHGNPLCGTTKYQWNDQVPVDIAENVVDGTAAAARSTARHRRQHVTFLSTGRRVSPEHNNNGRTLSVSSLRRYRSRHTPIGTINKDVLSNHPSSKHVKENYMQIQKLQSSNSHKRYRT